MINTWNPAEISDKLNQLEGQIQANDVIANPTGEATETLTKIGIDGDIYSFTAETTAADVSYDNTSSGLTADDVQDAIDELNTAIGNIPVIVRDTYTGTTNASGAISIPAANAPLEKTINIFVISPSGYCCNYSKGTTTYGAKVRERDSGEALASTECVFEIWKIK